MGAGECQDAPRATARGQRVAIPGAQEAVGVELGPLPARLNNPTGVAFNASGQFASVMGQAGTMNRGFSEGALLVTTGFTP